MKSKNKKSFRFLDYLGNNNFKRNLLMIIAFLVLIGVPSLIKLFGNQTYLSEEVYYHERIIDQIRNTNNLSFDLIQEQKIPINAFYIIMAYSFINTKWLIMFIPLLFALLSIYLLFKILEHAGVDEEIKYYSLIIAVLSPALLYTFIVFSPKNLNYFLALLTIFLLIRNKMSAIISLGFLLLSNILMGISVLIISSVFNLIFTPNNKVKNAYLFLASSIILLLIAFLDPIKISYELTSSYFGAGQFFSEFGSLEGYTIMILGLALIGLFYWWDKTKNKNSIILSLSFLFLTSFIYPSIKILLITIFSIYAGTAITYLIKREWRLEKKKNITLILIMCSLIFSTVLFNATIIKTITSEQTHGASYLRTSEPQDIILSSEENGFIIQNMAKRKTYLDSRSFKSGDYYEKISVAEKIYYSKNLAELKTELDNNSIKYIFLDSEMKQRLWNNKEEGLMFFLLRAKEFVKVYENDGVEIYRYIKDNDVENLV